VYPVLLMGGDRTRRLRPTKLWSSSPLETARRPRYWVDFAELAILKKWLLPSRLCDKASHVWVTIVDSRLSDYDDWDNLLSGTVHLVEIGSSGKMVEADRSAGGQKSSLSNSWKASDLVPEPDSSTARSLKAVVKSATTVQSCSTLER
jgi:hypothetical protein